jgi:hypothetical protein
MQSSNLSPSSFLSIRFLPFSIEKIPYSDNNKIDFRKSLKDWEPFDNSADLLYEISTNAFVGLSFSVSENYQVTVKNFAARCADNHIKYIDISGNTDDAIRYREFGKAHRLEILWRIPESN